MLLLVRRRVGERRSTVAFVGGREARRHVLAKQRDSPVFHAGVTPGGAAGIVLGKPIGKLSGKPIGNRGSLAQADAGENNVMNTSPA